MTIASAGGLMACGGNAPTAPTAADPNALIVSLQVRSLGVVQTPVAGVYRMPANATGSIHLMAAPPPGTMIVSDSDPSHTELSFALDSCDGAAAKVSRDFNFRLWGSEASEIASRTWSSWALVPGASWQPTELWPEPAVCRFTAWVSLKAPNLAVPAKKTTSATIEFY